MEWSLPEFPEPPLDTPTVQAVSPAFLTKVQHGPLATPHHPKRWIRGCVHDPRGKLVRASQKIGGLHGHPWVPADPGRVAVGRRAELLDGTWLYGGHWIQHFGHFLIETITTLWPETGPVDGLVFHKYLKRPWTVDPWQERVLELAGRGGLPIRVVGTGKALRVENLIVPSRTVVANGWAHRPAREVWERVASGFRGQGGPAKVFFSRTLFNEVRRREQHKKVPRTESERDRALDSLFAAEGFEVVSPETLDIDQQLRLAANAQVIAGCSGSALHLSAFASPGSRIIEIGDRRNVAQPVKLQLVIDTVCEHRRVFLRGDESPSGIASVLGSLDLGTSRSRPGFDRGGRGGG